MANVGIKYFNAILTGKLLRLNLLFSANMALLAFSLKLLSVGDKEPAALIVIPRYLYSDTFSITELFTLNCIFLHYLFLDWKDVHFVFVMLSDSFHFWQ